MSYTPIDYVVGYMFNPELTHVALIRKLRPAWQAGKLNGIGGKIERQIAETAIDAMVREFKEETGYDSVAEQWRFYLGFDYDDGVSLYFFSTVGDLTCLSTIEEEVVEIINLSDINITRSDMLDNVPWSIGLALSDIRSGGKIQTNTLIGNF